MTESTETPERPRTRNGMKTLAIRVHSKVLPRRIAKRIERIINEENLTLREVSLLGYALDLEIEPVLRPSPPRSRP